MTIRKSTMYYILLAILAVFTIMFSQYDDAPTPETHIGCYKALSDFYPKEPKLIDNVMADGVLTPSECQELFADAKESYAELHKDDILKMMARYRHVRDASKWAHGS